MFASQRVEPAVEKLDHEVKFRLAAAAAGPARALLAGADVGDSATLVGDTGLVVPPRHPTALRDALDSIVSSTAAERRAAGVRARERIVTEYSIARAAERYADAYREVIDNARQRG